MRAADSAEFKATPRYMQLTKEYNELLTKGTPKALAAKKKELDAELNANCKGEIS